MDVTLLRTDNLTTQQPEDNTFTTTNFMICFFTFLGLLYGLTLLPALSEQALHYLHLTTNKIRVYYDKVCNLIRGPDQPEPEQEEDLEPMQELELQQEEHIEPPNVHEELLRLQEANNRLEEEVQRLTLQLANKEAQLTETEDLLTISRRIAGEHYTEASLAKHRLEELQNNFGEIMENQLAARLERMPPNNDVQGLVTERINQLIRRPVHFSRSGEVWHFSRLCCQQRTTGPVITRRPCAWCAHDMRLRQEEDEG